MLAINTHDPKRRPDKSAGGRAIPPNPPSVVEPLTAETLAGRRSIILFRRRLRRLARPAYVNTDASWRDGIAGIAYESGAMGRRVELVSCGSNSRAEYLALLMAMGDAERCLTGPVCFRIDSTTVVNLQGRTPELLEPQEAIEALLARHPEWLLELITRQGNKVANGLARRPLLYPDKNDWLISSSALHQKTRRPQQS